MADVITTVEELDALPVGSVVLTKRRRVWIAHGTTGLGVAWSDAMGSALGSQGLSNSGPLTLLYRPDAPAPALPDEDRGILRDEAERAILAVWADVPGGVDAGTLADNIVRFQTGALAAPLVPARSERDRRAGPGGPYRSGRVAGVRIVR